LRFKRASYMINELETSIKTLIMQNKLGYIKGINPKIESIIKEIVHEDRSSYYDKLYKRIKSEYTTGKIL